MMFSSSGMRNPRYGRQQRNPLDFGAVVMPRAILLVARNPESSLERFFWRGVKSEAGHASPFIFPRERGSAD